jgi:hypothetical protein
MQNTEMVHRNMVPFYGASQLCQGKVVAVQQQVRGRLSAGNLPLQAFVVEKNPIPWYRVESNPCGSEEEDFILGLRLATF